MRLPNSGVMLLSLVPTFVSIGSCTGGSETGNPVHQALIGACAWSSDPDVVSLDVRDAPLRVDDVWIALGNFELRTGDECQQPATLDPAATSAVHELTSSIAPLGDVPAANYCGVSVSLTNATDVLQSEQPAELAHHSLIIIGTRSDNVPFVLRYPEAAALTWIGDFVMPDDGPLLLVFDVVSLLGDLDLDAAAVDASGVIAIDETHNATLLTTFERNLECAIELLRDDNGNGKRDDNDELLATCLSR